MLIQTSSSTFQAPLVPRHSPAGLTREGHLYCMKLCKYPVSLLNENDFEMIERLQDVPLAEIQAMIESSRLFERTIRAWHDIGRPCDPAEYYGSKLAPLRDLALQCPLLNDDDRAWLKALE